MPFCYFTGTDPAGHQSVIIIEDLVPRGVRFCHAQEPNGYRKRRHFWMHWRNAMRYGGIVRSCATKLSSDGSCSPSMRLRLVITTTTCSLSRWQHAIQQPRGAAISRAFHDREWMRNALRSLGQFHAGGIRTLTHGDTHLGNLYIEADGRPGFLDAQSRRAPWYHDVPYHIIGALDINDRRRWEHALLAGYLRRLADYGVADPPGFDEAFDAYRRSIVYGLFIFLINETRFQTESINTAYTARFAAAALDHGIPALYSGNDRV